MRWIALLVCIIVSVVFANAQPRLSDVTLNDHVRLAVDFLGKTATEDRQYIRFLSYYNYHDTKRLAEKISLMRFWINNLHRESDIEFPKPLTETLYYLDLRDYGWTTEAWSAVANREPYSNELVINSGYALALRSYSGVKQNSSSFSADSIVRGDWFFRETIEQDRSDSYLDLLFARERFGKAQSKRVQVDWKGGDYNGRYLKPGAYYYDDEVATKKDFPGNETEYEKVFGVDIIRKFIKDTKLNLQRGAVVEGGEKSVSIVSRQNRLIERTEGPIGWYYKTYDVKETSGRRDFAETLQKDFEYDAGEILARLPGGGQASLLVDSKGTILKVADNRFANDSSDYRYDTRVRNPQCVVCHQSGIIKPDNLVEQMLKSGIDIKFKDKREARDARSYFLNWDRKLSNDQAEYADFLKKTSGLGPSENSLAFKSFRDEYDSPVTSEVAAREMGMSLNMFKAVGSRSTKARILMLIKDISIPRKTWEVDGYKEMAKLMNADRKYP